MPFLTSINIYAYFNLKEYIMIKCSEKNKVRYPIKIIPQW